MARRTLLAGVLVSIGCFSASGCGGSTGEGGSAAPVPADEFVKRYVDAVCDSVGPCCQQAGITYDPAGCKALGYADFGEEFDPNQPNVSYDANAAGRCIEEIRQAIQSCGGLAGIDSAWCEKIFNGTLPAGAACQRDDECAEPLDGFAYCDETLVCVVQGPGKAGDVCSGTCTEDESGMDCFSSSTMTPGAALCFTNDGVYCDETCKTLAAIGEPCVSSQPYGCVDGAFCNGSTCASLPAVGQPCTPDLECAADAWCDDTTCQAPLPLGAACSFPGQCQTRECDGVCTEPNIASTEICSGQSA